jgi:hypothetical protein
MTFSYLWALWAGEETRATSARSPTCHLCCPNPVVDLQRRRPRAGNPDAVGIEPDSAPESKNWNRSHIKKSPLRNPSELHRFETQTQDRIGLESKHYTPDLSPYK